MTVLAKNWYGYPLTSVDLTETSKITDYPPSTVNITAKTTISYLRCFLHSDLVLRNFGESPQNCGKDLFPLFLPLFLIKRPYVLGN